MSNPAVIKLSEKNIRKCRVYMDDNYGESIHIHIDDYRVDLSVTELKSLYEDLCISLNSLVNIDNFNAFDLDPVFISHMLWKDLEHLKQVKYDKVYLEDMYGPYQLKYYKLKDSIGLKLLKGQMEEAEGYRKCNHIGQSDIKRYHEMIDSLKKNGYPYNNNYIVMYGDDNIIRDGQHRASCLYHMYGNIEVPVVRYYFDNYTSPNLGAFYNSSICVHFRNAKIKTYSLIKKVRKMYIRLLNKLSVSASGLRTQVKNNDDKDVLSLFECK